MNVLFFFTKLKEGVSTEEYENWVREVDYAKVKEIPSIKSYKVYRIEDNFVESNISKTYDYLEVIEVSDLDSYKKDMEQDPNFKVLIEQIGKYLDLEGNFWGIPISPGVRKV